MTPGEFKKIAQTMKLFGITRFRMGDVEIDLGSSQAVVPHRTVEAPMETQEPSSDPIKHRVEQVGSLLKLSDHELVDQLFPEHHPPEAS